MPLSSSNPASLPESVNIAGSKSGLTSRTRIGRNLRRGSGKKVPNPVEKRLADSIWPALYSSGKGASIGSRKKGSASARITADEQKPTTAASRQQRRSSSRDLGTSSSARNLRDAGLAVKIPSMSGYTYRAPVKDLTGSGVGPGTRKRTSSVRGPVSRKLFDNNLGEASEDLPKKTVSDDDFQAVDDGISRVKRRLVARCRNDECVAMKGVLKNKIESLEEQVKRERGSV